MNETTPALLFFEYVMHGLMALLSGTATSAADATEPAPLADNDHSALLFLEATDTADAAEVASDVDTIISRLEFEDFRVEKVWQKNQQIVLHVTGPAFQKDQFDVMLLSGQLFIGEAGEHFDWQTAIKPDVWPAGISLETMPPFAQPVPASENPDILRQLFPRITAQGDLPFVTCIRSTVRPAQQCALQVLNRAHEIRRSHVGHMMFRENLSRDVLEMSMEIIDLNTMEMDPDVSADLFEMQRIVFVMDGEAPAPPATFENVSTTGFRVSFEESDSTRPRGINGLSSRFRLALNVFSYSDLLTHHWHLDFIQPVRSSVAAK